MRSLLIASVFVLLIPCHICAQAPETAYIGIYSDYDHTTWCASGTPPYEIDVWIWVLPSDRGVEWFGYNLAYPSGYSIVATEGHPDLVDEIVEPGPPESDWMFRGLYDRCPKPGWIWTMHLQFSVPDSAPGIIEIVAHPEFGDFGIQNCSGEWEPCIKLTNVFVNYAPDSPECSTMPVHQSTWGAIKGIMH
jgi:hypothetical protein